MSTLQHPTTSTDAPKTVHDDLATAGSEGLFPQLWATFRSPMRPWVIYVAVMGFVAFGAMIWSAFAFFAAETVQDSILYATLFITFGLTITIVKVWYYVEAARYSTSREIRRLERRIDAMRTDGR